MTEPAATPVPPAPPAAVPDTPPPGPWPRDESVLWVDDSLIVCDKPAGLLAVPGRGEHGQQCLLAWLQRRWPDAEVVHRLDMATSGLMVFARGKASQRALSAQFASRTVHKRYEAVVAGTLRPDVADVADAGWSTIDLPLACDWPNRPLQKVDPLHGKPSRTRWCVLSHHEDTTRVALEPVTGRSHQLRVHLQALGHPIVGDLLYAPAPWRTRAARLLLHAAQLTFEHPVQGSRRLAFTQPAPF